MLSWPFGNIVQVTLSPNKWVIGQMRLRRMSRATCIVFQKLLWSLLIIRRITWWQTRFIQRITSHLFAVVVCICSELQLSWLQIRELHCPLEKTTQSAWALGAALSPFVFICTFCEVRTQVLVLAQLKERGAFGARVPFFFKHVYSGLAIKVLTMMFLPYSIVAWHAACSKCNTATDRGLVPVKPRVLFHSVYTYCLLLDDAIEQMKQNCCKPCANQEAGKPHWYFINEA